MSTRGHCTHSLIRYAAEHRHFVAHSYGGLVTLRMFSLFPEQAAGRIVLLGSPLLGSRVARKAGRIPGGTLLIGEARAALEQGYLSLPPDHAVGMIAGTRRFGLGLLVGEFRTPGDGTVALEETRVSGLSQHLQMPLTHTGLVTARSAAGNVAVYLREGHFSATD